MTWHKNLPFLHHRHGQTTGWKTSPCLDHILRITILEGTVSSTARGSPALSRNLVRALLASAAIASAVALSGCDTDGTSPLTTARAMAPLSNEMLSLLEQKN